MAQLHFFDDESAREFDREHRVRLLGQFAESALAGREISKESLLFVAGAIHAWLERGGSLERKYLGVTAVAGSHHTPARVWQSTRSPREDAHGKTLSVGCIPLPLPRVEK